MQVKTKAIVISALKYQEKSLIVKCFTQSDGLKSYFVRNAYSKVNQKIAYFQPLTIIEIEANHKNKGTLEHFKEIKLAHSFQTIHTNIIKSTIVLFLSEILYNSIHEEEKNENLFSFLENALLWLDSHEEAANFHLILMMKMTKYLGFYPDITEIDFDFFDINEGFFSPFQTNHTLSLLESQLFKRLITINFDSNQNTFNVTDRQTLLKTLLDFYNVHLEGFKKPKSLVILRDIFS